MEATITADNNQTKDMLLPSDFIQKALDTLPERAREIMKRRFRLGSGEKGTLEHIGREFDITRERVRQIEKGAIKKMREKNLSEISIFGAVFLEFMDRDGRAAEQDFFLGQLADFIAKKYPGADAEREKRNIVLILKLAGRIKSRSADKKFKKIFYASDEGLKAAEAAVDAVINFLESENRPMSEEEMFSKIKPVGLVGQRVASGVFGSYIRLSREIAKNPFGQWGLGKWPLVLPRNIRDKSYLIALRQKEPLHFKKMARRIGEIWGEKKRPVLSETVHNELIKDKRFVLVGRGIYALAEWGYEKGTVRDIMRNILAEANRPMHRDEIVKEVSDRRLVKPSTIVLNLKDAEFFEKTAEGLYKLKVQSAK